MEFIMNKSKIWSAKIYEKIAEKGFFTDLIVEILLILFLMTVAFVCGYYILTTFLFNFFIKFNLFISGGGIF